MKNLIFSQDDIILALLDSVKDSFARAEIVKSLIDAKLKRLRSDEKFESRKFSKDFGSMQEIEGNWKKFSTAERKKCNNKIKKINSLIKQINALNDYRQELNKTSFGNESLDSLESNIKKVFKWERPIFHEDIYHG